MIRQPEGRGVERKVHFRPVRRKSYAEDGFWDKKSLTCDSEAQQNLSQWWKCDKIAQEGKKIARTDGKKATLPQGERDWKSRSARWNKINQTHQHLKLHLSSIYCALFQIRFKNKFKKIKIKYFFLILLWSERANLYHCFLLMLQSPLQ